MSFFIIDCLLRGVSNKHCLLSLFSFVSDLFGHLEERSNRSFMGITHISAKDFRMLLAVNISHVHVYIKGMHSQRLSLITELRGNRD